MTLAWISHNRPSGLSFPVRISGRNGGRWAAWSLWTKAAAFYSLVGGRLRPQNAQC